MHSVEERFAPLAVFQHTGDVVELKKVHRTVAAAGIPEVMKHVVPVIEPHPGEAGISSKRKRRQTVVQRDVSPATESISMRMIAGFVNGVRQTTVNVIPLECDSGATGGRTRCIH